MDYFVKICWIQFDVREIILPVAEVKSQREIHISINKHSIILLYNVTNHSSKIIY